MKSSLSTTILILILIISTAGFGFASPPQSGQDVPATLFEHMRHTELLKVTMEIDIDSLLQNKRTKNFIPAKFSFHNNNGELRDWAVEVRVRGRFRRMTCDFPPLKLKFPKAEMKAEGFGKHNDVKLVTHCIEDKKGEENLFREYLAYQMYAELTDVSFRTQLIQITYRDTQTGSETETYGILIEDSDELAERIDTKDCEDCFGKAIADFDQTNLQTHDLFQYMIGNTDWSLASVRNMKILKPENEGGKSFIAPYDFDFSGMVNAAYAKPNVDLKQKDIRDRYYLGADWTVDEWSNTISMFIEKRQALMDIVDQFEFLNNKAKKDIKKYLDGFYEELAQGFVPQNYFSIH